MEKHYNESYNNNIYYNPFQISGMYEALNRIVKAVNEREKIFIFGRTDLDGIIGISLLKLILEYLNADVDYYTPDKQEYSNSLSKEIIENHVKLFNADLIITVGCSIKLKETAETCKNSGIDVIVTDYNHDFKDYPGMILVNPNTVHSKYPFKELNLSGIAYKIAQSIANYYHLSYIEKYLDIVAISIIASGASLNGENLLLVQKGMTYLEKSNNHGLNALKNHLKIEKVNLDTMKKLSSLLLPEENVFGRMDDARIIIEFLTTNDKERAKRIAKYIINKRK